MKVLYSIKYLQRKEDEMEKSNISRSVIYNTIGTFFYFFCQWLTTILVVRISGYEDAGILSIVISFTNIFYFIALFGVRNFQVTDINHEFTDRDYLNSWKLVSRPLRES